MNEKVTTRQTKPKADEPNLAFLLRQVPVDLFVRMVSNASLPPNDSRALIAAFKANQK